MNESQTELIKTFIELYAIQGKATPECQDETLSQIIEFINSYIKQAKDEK